MSKPKTGIAKDYKSISETVIHTKEFLSMTNEVTIKGWEEKVKPMIGKLIMRIEELEKSREKWKVSSKLWKQKYEEKKW